MSALHVSNQSLRQLGRTLLLGTCLTLAVTAASAKDAPGLKTSSGDYLAGYHADQLGNTADALGFYGKAAKDPVLAQPGLYKRIYLLALSEGRIPDAIRALETVEKAGGKVPFANLILSIQAIKNKDYPRAETLIRTDKGGLSPHLNPPLLAWVKFAQRDIDGAMKALETLNEQKGMATLFHMYAALILDANANAPRARKHFLNLLKGGGLSNRMAKLTGEHFERAKDHPKAREIFNKYAITDVGLIMRDQATARMKKGTRPELDIQTAQDGVAEALLSIAVAYQAQTSGSQALILSNLALYLREDLARAQMIKADALEIAGNYPLANTVYAGIAKSSPHRWMAQLRTALNLEQLERDGEAIRLLKDLARERKDLPSPLGELGHILRSNERFADAAEAYSDAIDRSGKTNKRHWILYYNRGVAYEASKQWPKAEKDFLKALELNPDQPDVLNYLSYSWIDQGLHLKRALKMIEKAVDLRPRDGYIVDSLGWGLYRLGKYDQAVRKLERAIMLRPSDPVINDHLGDALWKVGRTREAKFQWERAKTLGPEEKLLKIINQKLKSGLADSSQK
ncbi:tetratricopeptide repeat protein [Magnetovibrio sp. PR-2]|uniref:tetratricopeptide repeat protein n=1 Tax=Magnetovibrio sp. PR-2 TaxID=3120356 RepID=UPI002FCE1FD5